MPIKYPLHPGKIASDLLDLAPYKTIVNDLHIYEAEWREFVEGRSDIDHILAYRLSQCIECTDMAFWLKLQQDYDYREDNLRFQKDVAKVLEHEALRIGGEGKVRDDIL